MRPEQAAVQEDGPIQEECREGQEQESGFKAERRRHCRRLRQQVTAVERHEFETRAMQNWNMKNVNVARSPGSGLRVFTSSERLANQMKINENGEVGKLVKKIGMGGPQAGKLMKNVETGGMKSWRISEEDPDERAKSWKNLEVGKIWSRGIHET